VLIVDDHRMFAESLIRLLEDQPDFLAVGVAGSVAEATRLARSARPDVVLLDYRLPDGDAPACIAQLRQDASDAQVLVMTGLTDAGTMRAALSAGCAGIVTKDRAAHDLVAALRAVVSGEPLEATGATAPGEMRSNRSGTLSTREREIVAHLAAGQSTEEIAETLFISPVTVRNHVQRALAKLGARSRLEAVAISVREGIVSPPTSQGPGG